MLNERKVLMHIKFVPPILLNLFQVQLAEIPAIVLNDSEINVSKKRKFAKVTAPSDKNKYVLLE